MGIDLLGAVSWGLTVGTGPSEQCLMSDGGDGSIRAVSWVCQSRILYLMMRTALSDTVPVSDRAHSAGLCSEACLLRRSHCDSPPLLRAGSVGKNKLPPCKKVPQQLSKTTTRSLGDLKGYRGTRGLVARFLQRPKRSPAAGMEVSGHSFHGHKQVGPGSHRGWAAPPSQRTPIHILPPFCPHQHLHPGPSTASLPLPHPHGAGTLAAGRAFFLQLCPCPALPGRQLLFLDPHWSHGWENRACCNGFGFAPESLHLEAAAGTSRQLSFTGCRRLCTAREALTGTSLSQMPVWAHDARLCHPCHLCPPAPCATWLHWSVKG